MTARLAGCVLILAWVAAPASAQVLDPKADFIQALARFSVALEGRYGDEGAIIRSSLDAMEQGLARWDALIENYERAMAADIARATPELAARMHMAMGIVYVDRNRLAEGRAAFATARALAPTLSDVHTFEALVHSQLSGDAGAAAEAFRRAASLEPGNLLRAYMLGRHLRKHGRTEEARSVLEVFHNAWLPPAAPGDMGVRAPFVRFSPVQEVTGVEPFFPPVLYEDGFARLRERQYAEAIAAFRTAIARDPLVANAEPMQAAAAAFRDGAIAAALRHLDAAAQASPSRAEPLRIRGAVLAADGRYREAIEALRTAMRLRPDDERVRLGLADVLIDSGDLEAAEQALHQSIDLIPASGRAHYVLARLYHRLGRYPEALRAFEAAATFQPLLGLNAIYRDIGALHAAVQDLDEAAAAYERRIDVHPNDPDAHHDLGDTYLRQGRHVEALAEFAVALLLDPAHADAYASAGQLLLREGRYADAVEAARRALAQNPADKETRYVLGTALVRLGRADEGRRELEEYQRLQAEEAAALARALELQGLRREASVAADDGNHDRAVALLEQVLEREPESPAAHLDVAVALLNARRYAEAIPRLEQAAARNAHMDVYRWLAEAHAALGQQAESARARATYERLRREALRQP